MILKMSFLSRSGYSVLLALAAISVGACAATP